MKPFEVSSKTWNALISPQLLGMNAVVPGGVKAPGTGGGDTLGAGVAEAGGVAAPVYVTAFAFSEPRFVHAPAPEA